jgi:hypothetical protein
MQCKSLICYSNFKCYKENNTNRNTKNCVFQQEPVLSIFKKKKNYKYTLKSFLLHFLLAKSLIKSSKLFLPNKSVSIRIPASLVSSFFCLDFLYASFERMSVQLFSLWPLMLKYTQANLYFWLIDWLISVFNATFSNISAISWRVYLWKSTLSSIIIYSTWLNLAYAAFVALNLCRIYEWNCWSSVDKLLFKSSG